MLGERKGSYASAEFRAVPAARGCRVTADVGAPWGKTGIKRAAFREPGSGRMSQSANDAKHQRTLSEMLNESPHRCATPNTGESPGDRHLASHTFSDTHPQLSRRRIQAGEFDRPLILRAPDVCAICRKLKHALYPFSDGAPVSNRGEH